MSKPKIRFNGFTEDWEQRKVKEFIDEGIIEVPMDGNHGEKHPTASEYVNNGIPFLMASDIHNGEVDINYCKYITRERAEKLDKGFAKNGDVLITHKATIAVSYTHLRAHETQDNLVCRLLLEKNFFNDTATTEIYTMAVVGSVRCV